MTCIYKLYFTNLSDFSGRLRKSLLSKEIFTARFIFCYWQFKHLININSVRYVHLKNMRRVISELNLYSMVNNRRNDFQFYIKILANESFTARDFYIYQCTL